MPKRVVPLSFGAAELMCAMGLTDKLAAIAPAEGVIRHVLPEYRKLLEQIPVMRSQGDGVPTAKELQEFGADFILCSFYYPKMIGQEAAAGLPVYITESTVPGPVSYTHLIVWSRMRAAFI